MQRRVEFLRGSRTSGRSGSTWAGATAPSGSCGARRRPRRRRRSGSGRPPRSRKWVTMAAKLGDLEIASYRRFHLAICQDNSSQYERRRQLQEGDGGVEPAGAVAQRPVQVDGEPRRRSRQEGLPHRREAEGGQGRPEHAAADAGGKTYSKTSYKRARSSRTGRASTRRCSRSTSSRRILACQGIPAPLARVQLRREERRLPARDAGGSGAVRPAPQGRARRLARLPPPGRRQEERHAGEDPRRQADARLDQGRRQGPGALRGLPRHRRAERGVHADADELPDARPLPLGVVSRGEGARRDARDPGRQLERLAGRRDRDERRRHVGQPRLDRPRRRARRQEADAERRARSPAGTTSSSATRAASRSGRASSTSRRARWSSSGTGRSRRACW
jgi:hypothetical protein